MVRLTLMGTRLLKKFRLLSVIFVLLAGGLYAQEMNLNEVIARAARGVEEALPRGTMVAVLNFVSPSETFSDHVIEELTGELVTGRKLTIVDRHNLALISEEMNLQLSGDVSDESAQAIGKMLGAQSIVSGTLTNMGTFYRFRVRVIQVETAAIQTQISLDMQNNAQIAFLLDGGSASAQSSDSGSRQTKSASDRNNDAWKNKWVYLGGGLGVGGTTVTKTTRFSIPDFPYYYNQKKEETALLFAPWFLVDLSLLAFFSIELGFGLGLGPGAVNVVPVIPILAKLGYKIAQIRMELSFDAGYTVLAGFTLGGTAGVNVGPGILFAKFLIIPKATPFEGNGEYRLLSGMMGFLGYKTGIGDKRKKT